MSSDTAESGTPQLLAAPNIAIVGFAEGHAHEAPYDDASFELWGINRLHTVEAAKDKRFDRWFNLHDLEMFHGQDTEHLEFLKNFGGPVYLRPQDIGKFDIPNAVPFPWEQLVSQFGRYFNNTISWLIAYAIVHNPSKLGVYGVDMAQDALLNAEYSQQRPSCEYFLGLARGVGIEIMLPTGSDLLKATHLYGFEDADTFTQKGISRLNEVGSRKEAAKAEMANIDGQIAQLNAKKQDIFAAINQLDGAMQDVQYWLRNWVPQHPGEPVVESQSGKELDASTDSDD